MAFMRCHGAHLLRRKQLHWKALKGKRFRHGSMVFFSFKKLEGTNSGGVAERFSRKCRFERWNIVKLGEHQVNPHKISKNLGLRKFSMCEQINEHPDFWSLMCTAGAHPSKYETCQNKIKQTPPECPCRCNPTPVKRWIWCWDLQTLFNVGFLKQFDYHPLKLLLVPCWSGYLQLFLMCE